MVIDQVFIPDLDMQKGWPLNLVWPIENPCRNRKIGDLFFYDERRYGARDDWKMVHSIARKEMMGPHYLKYNSHRLPLVVLLPSRTLHCVDSMCWDEVEGYYGGWMVSGTAPELTVNSTINITGSYQGFITKGWMTPDINGRKFFNQYTIPVHTAVGP